MPEPEDPTYEQLVEALDVVVDQLETGGLPLDQAVEAYERGADLSRRAQALLDAAELRIATLRNES